MRFRQHCSAVRIQSWWRGYQVRREFGLQIAKIRQKIQEKLQEQRRKQEEETRR